MAGRRIAWALGLAVGLHAALFAGVAAFGPASSPSRGPRAPVPVSVDFAYRTASEPARVLDGSPMNEERAEPHGTAARRGAGLSASRPTAPLGQAAERPAAGVSTGSLGPRAAERRTHNPRADELGPQTMERLPAHTSSAGDSRSSEGRVSEVVGDGQSADSRVGGGDGSRSGEGGGGSGTGAGVSESEVIARISRRLQEAAADCYPEPALRLRSSRSVSVRFCIGDDGAPRDVSIVRSAGLALFDDAAIACVLPRAAPLPRLGRCLSAPIEFRYRER